MDAIESLRAALQTYYQAIEAQKSGQPADLTAAVMELERWSTSPDPSLHPQLRHYLESRSYRKAWEFLGKV